MTLYRGNNQAAKLYVGRDEVQKVYVGATEVYANTSNTPTGSGDLPSDLNQVLSFSSSNGLVQSVPGLSGGALDADGIWMAGYVFFDGANWKNGALMGFSDADVGFRQLVLQTNRAVARNDSFYDSGILSTPTAPGWYLCVSHVHQTGLNRASIKFWRNNEYTQEVNQNVKSDVSTFDTVGVGLFPYGATSQHLSMPACGFAWGYGDPSALHAWAYNDGQIRNLLEYDFASDSDLTLESYWAGAREGTAGDFAVSEANDLVGELSSWTEVGTLAWADRVPPWIAGAGGVAGIQSVTVAADTPNQVTVIATLPRGAFVSPEIVHTEAEFDLWTTRGFGPIRAQSASSAVMGNQVTVTLTLNRNLYASEEVFFQTGSGWLSDGNNEGAKESGTVINNSGLSNPALATGLSFGTVAVGFAAEHQVGFYQDNLGYVVDAGSGVEIIDTYPSPATAARGREQVDLHGATKNPRRQLYEHGYDGRNTASGFTRYTQDRNDALEASVSMTVYDSFVKVRSNINLRSENGGTSYHPVYLEQAWGLYVTSAVPGENDFCPPLVGYDGASARPTMSLNVNAIAASLPSYSTSGHDRPPIAEVAARVNRYNPCAVQIRSVEDRRHLTPSGITEADGYGLKYAQTLNAASLCLIGDDATAEKAEIVRGLASWGWQWYHGLKAENGSIGPDGGQSQYHPFPMILALAWSGASAAEVGAVATDIPANLFGQTARLDASLVSAVMNPHGTVGESLPKSPNDNLPYASHRKLVSSVSGNTITMATAREAEIGGSARTNPKIGHVGMRLRRESDGLTALIVAENAADRAYTIDSASGFAVGDVVFVIPPYEAAVGDYEWSVIGYPNNANSFGPDTSYRSLNSWSGMVLAVRALGLMHANFEAWEGYVARANEADNPTAASDYPHHHSTYIGVGPNEPRNDTALSWDRGFWNQHWSTISSVTSRI